MESLTLGWELETERIGCSGGATRALARRLGRTHLGPALREVKSDCTLRNGGAEIVSEPRTLAQWRALRPNVNAYLRELQRSGYRSWRGGHCGFHIHVGRAELSAPALVRLVQLVYQNREHWYALSGRTSQRYCPFNVNLDAAIRECNGGYVEGWFGHWSRTAVCLTWKGTVEFRFWRGALGPHRFWYALETVHAMAAYAAATADATEPVSLAAYLEYASANYRSLTVGPRRRVPCGT